MLGILARLLPEAMHGRTISRISGLVRGTLEVRESSNRSSQRHAIVAHVRPVRWETKHLQGMSPESINIKVNELLEDLHRKQCEIREVSITNRDVQYGTGPLLTHYHAWVIYTHAVASPLREPDMATARSN
jgi:hypothetical protein